MEENYIPFGPEWEKEMNNFSKKELTTLLKDKTMRNKHNVIRWGAEKGILMKATPMSQAIKTLSEVEELLRAINSGDLEETKDAYGDILVTIILGAELSGFDIEDCLQGAYDVISKRTGTMINGQFVKDK